MRKNDSRNLSRSKKPGRGARGPSLLVSAILFVLIGLFLLGYLSPLLPPRLFWWTGLLASALPYLAGLSVVAAGVAWIAFRGRWYLAFLSILVLVAFRFLSLDRFAGGGDESDEDLVVMTFNAPVRGPNPETLSNVTVDLVDQVDPDILALQEPMIWIANDGRERRATAHLQAVIDSLEYWAPTPDQYGRTGAISQPVVARFPLGDPDQILFPSEERSGRNTFATRTPFQWQGQQAVLYNVHLFTTGERKPWLEAETRFSPRAWYAFLRDYKDAYARRVSEARQLRQLIEEEDLPFIVAGDFNSTIHHWEFNHIADGLRDVFTVRGQGWGGTYHMELPLFRIDHILVSPEWDILSAHVPKTRTLSDHRPVVGRIRLAETTP